MAEPASRRVLMLFLDGVGLGGPDPDCNPLFAADLPRLASLAGGRLVAGTAPRQAPGVVYRRLDAGLGVAGLPQSATGQTSLLTGENGAELMGRHYGPWPGPTLRRVLEGRTLFHEAASAALANAYPEGYFRALEGRRLRPNAPVVAARAAGVPLIDLEAYRAGEGLGADVTGAGFTQIDAALVPLEPAEAACRLRRLAARHAFTFYDVWPTDRYGHQQRRAEAVKLLEDIDALVGGLESAFGDITLLLTSDHGNLEDLSSPRHTRNPVPLLAVGPDAAAYADVDDLMQVGRVTRALLTGG
ncbi:MAG: hypothetical protein P8Z81_07730 [Deinococcales bacterium]